LEIPLLDMAENKNAIFIIAFKDFRDEEYFRPKEILEKAGFRVSTVSTEKGLAHGTDGGEAKVDFTADSVKVADFDAIIFIGGPGAAKNQENQTFHRLAKEAAAQNKIIAAICIAPTILARAGILEGKRATVWSSALDRRPIQLIQEEGAIFENKPVVVDARLVTATGPQVVKEFAEAIIQVSKKK